MTALRAIQTEPTVEPVNLNDVKNHLVVEGSHDDPLLAQMIVAARRHIENRCNRVLVRQKWRLYMDSFSAFALEPAKVQEVDQIQYLDGDGATQTLATSVYTADIPAQLVYLAFEQSWPVARYVKNAVWADVWSGYYNFGDSPINVLADMPQDITYAVLMLIAHLYEHRASNIELVTYKNPAFDALVQPHIYYSR